MDFKAVHLTACHLRQYQVLKFCKAIEQISKRKYNQIMLRIISDIRNILKFIIRSFLAMKKQQQQEPSYLSIYGMK